MKLEDIKPTKIEDYPEAQFRNAKDGEWLTLNLLSIVKDFPFQYYTINGAYKQMRPIPEEKMRPMTHPEIFKAISGGAVVRYYVDKYSKNYWNSGRTIKDYEISYDFGETWSAMEVEE